MTDEKTNGILSGKWIPVLAIVVAVAIIGVYYLAVVVPGQAPPPVAPENDDIITAAPVHTVQWQNNCGFDVYVDILGGTLYYPNPSNTNVKYSACQELPDGTCVPNTRCDGVAHGVGNKNKCTGGDPMVEGGGFKLDARSGNTQGTHTTSLQKSWQGAFWGRTGCKADGNSLTCDVGDCKVYSDGKGRLQCGGQGPFGPYHLTKGEFNLNELGSDIDYYDVSLVDGYNIPLRIELKPGSFSSGANTNKNYDCTISEASKDLLPLFDKSGLSTAKLGGYLGTKLVSVESACEYAKENDPQNINKYCCLGEYGPGKCDPSTWPADIRTAPFFKDNNPKAYSFAYNDASSTYMCRNKDAATLTSYIVTFCPDPAAGNIVGNIAPVQSAAPVNIPAPVLTTVVPTQTPVSTQTAVPNAPYNPASSGGTGY